MVSRYLPGFHIRDRGSLRLQAKLEKGAQRENEVVICRRQMMCFDEKKLMISIHLGKL